MEERTSARSKGTNRVEVPEARGALDKFKFEVANEIGVDLKDGDRKSTRLNSSHRT